MRRVTLTIVFVALCSWGIAGYADGKSDATPLNRLGITQGSALTAKTPDNVASPVNQPVK